MGLIDREVGMAVAATTALLSPRAREIARKGAVYGLAGVLKVGDVVAGTARGAARGASEGVSGSNGDASKPQATTTEDPGGTESAPTAEAAAVAQASETSTRSSSTASPTSSGISSGGAKTS